jgi:hypothetical protein
LYYGTAQPQTGFVSGHGFSRADEANKTNGALAPEVQTIQLTHDPENQFSVDSRRVRAETEN